MNKTVKNEITVTPVKKSVVKKSTKKVAPVTTAAKNNEVVNKSVKRLLLTFDETIQLMNECGIGSKSNTKNYRIMNGGSSIHVLKTMYRIYMTPIDFELVSSIKSDDIKLLINDNIVDVKRPHTVTCTSTNALKQIFECISKNKLNAPC